jgi:hypothetical protein
LSIENKLHRCSDITFKEDDCWVRSGYVPKNLSIIRKFALQRIKKQKDKLDLAKRQYNATMDINYQKKTFRLIRRPK